MNNKQPIIWNKGDREFKEDLRAYAKGLEMKKVAYLSRDQNWVREWLMSLLGKSFSKIVNKSKPGVFNECISGWYYYSKASWEKEWQGKKLE